MTEPTQTPRRRFNPLGLVAVILVGVSWLIPIVIFAIVAFTPASYSTPGTLHVIEATLIMIYVIPYTAIIAIVGVVLGGVSLALKGRRKVLGIIAIIVGIPMAANIWLLAIILTSNNGPTGVPL